MLLDCFKYCLIENKQAAISYRKTPPFNFRIYTLELSAWEIAMGKGYDPCVLPQGKPVRQSDLEEVPIFYTH